MKIAITADLHLKTNNETPERYNALKNIIEKINKLNINKLFILGDTFDKENNNYSDFDNICSKFNNIEFFIIPGNHDPNIEQRYFYSKNVEIINLPTIKTFENINLLFIPYNPYSSMDELIVKFFYENQTNYNLKNLSWILLSHGDYISGRFDYNTYEDNFYMPLSLKVINEYNPLKVFLGHIHKSDIIGNVYYPGSPFPININEPGVRSFLIYDLSTNIVEKLIIDTDYVYYNEEIFIYPIDNEKLLLEKKLETMINCWDINKEILEKVILRLKLKGWCYKKKDVLDNIKNYLNKFKIRLYDSDDYILSELNVYSSLDYNRILLINKVVEKIEKLNINNFIKNKNILYEEIMNLILR